MKKITIEADIDDFSNEIVNNKIHIFPLQEIMIFGIKFQYGRICFYYDPDVQDIYIYHRL